MIELPDPYAAGQHTASVEWSRRTVTIRLSQPGEIARNRFSVALVEIREVESWRGDRLAYGGARALPGDSWPARAWTDPAQRHMAATLGPIVARYGFARWWDDLHRSQTRPAGDDGSEIVEWCRRRDHVVDLYGLGLLDVVPVRGGETQVTIVHVHGLATSTALEPATARLVLDGEHVGWITGRGRIAPVR